MPASRQFGLHRPEFRPHPCAHRLPHEQEAPLLGFPADMREAQEVERLRLSEPTLPSVRGREAAEFEESRLLGVQFQAESRKALAKVLPEPLRLQAMLEADD